MNYELNIKLIIEQMVNASDKMDELVDAIDYILRAALIGYNPDESTIHITHVDETKIDYFIRTGNKYSEPRQMYWSTFEIYPHNLW